MTGEKITHFRNAEEAVAYFSANRERADAAVQSWQTEGAVYGACFVRIEPDLRLIIYGEILEVTDEEDRQLYAMSHMRNTRFTRCYSKIEPDGEYGNVHIATMACFVARDDFELFRKAGWPNLLPPQIRA